MPSKTPKQAKTMRAAAHNPAFAKKMGIPTGVAKEFNMADAISKFADGGLFSGLTDKLSNFGNDIAGVVQDYGTMGLRSDRAATAPVAAAPEDTSIPTGTAATSAYDAQNEMNRQENAKRAAEGAAYKAAHPSGYKHGGLVRMVKGGKVKGPGNGTSDSVPAMLSHGEYVMPADSVRKIGADKLDAIKNATHNPVGMGPMGGLPHMADGGLDDKALTAGPGLTGLMQQYAPAVAPAVGTVPRSAQLNAESVQGIQNEQGITLDPNGIAARRGDLGGVYSTTSSNPPPSPATTVAALPTMAPPAGKQTEFNLTGTGTEDNAPAAAATPFKAERSGLSPLEQEARDAINSGTWSGLIRGKQLSRLAGVANQGTAPEIAGQYHLAGMTEYANQRGVAAELRAHAESERAAQEGWKATTDVMGNPTGFYRTKGAAGGGPEFKTMAQMQPPPTQEEFMAKARIANPKMSESDLLAQYGKQYKKAQ